MLRASEKNELNQHNKNIVSSAWTAAELFEHLIIKKVVFQVNIYYKQDGHTTLLR
jgi:hypothetical protein